MNLLAYVYRTRVSGPPGISGSLRTAGGQPAQTERRSTRRFALALPVEVSVDRTSQQAVKGRTRDVSSDGIYFLCNKTYMAGQLLYITMNLAGGEVGGGDSISLTVGGHVQRVEETLLGGVKVSGIAVALHD